LIKENEFSHYYRWRKRIRAGTQIGTPPPFRLPRNLMVRHLKRVLLSAQLFSGDIDDMNNKLQLFVKGRMLLRNETIKS